MDIRVGLLPETKEDNELELSRMKEAAVRWGFVGGHYSGPTNDIELNRRWFCPHCLDKSSMQLRKLSAIELSSSAKGDVYGLYCTDIEIDGEANHCGYFFLNKDARKVSRAGWWGEDFKYPLTESEMIDAKIDRNQAMIDSLQYNLSALLKSLESFKVERESLRKAGLEIKSSQQFSC